MRTRVAGLAAVAGLLVFVQPASIFAQEKGLVRRAWEGSWEVLADVTTPHPTRGVGQKLYEAMVGGPSKGLQPVPRGMNAAMSKPGYRAKITPESLAHYRHCMEKLGRGEQLNWSEAWTAQFMQATRQWPEKPVTSDADRFAQNWADNPRTWRDGAMSRATLLAQSAGGKFEFDLPPPPNMDRFRQLYHNTPPERRTTVMNGLMKLFTAQSYDMRSDKQRKEDEDWEKAEEEKRAAAQKEPEQEAPELTQHEKDLQIVADMRKQHDGILALQNLKTMVEASKDERFEPGMISGDEAATEPDPDKARERLLDMIRESKLHGPEYGTEPKAPQEIAQQTPPAGEGAGGGQALIDLIDLIGGVIESTEELDDDGEDEDEVEDEAEAEDDDLFGDDDEDDDDSGYVYVPPSDDDSDGDSSHHKKHSSRHKKSSKKKSSHGKKSKSSGSCSGSCR
ncbi:MAG: hypothetical protein JXB04_03745 [Kiritimatiellae bacterium]|nr:hypothetical protein [Kiritimatiellia bacterium]